MSTTPIPVPEPQPAPAPEPEQPTPPVAEPDMFSRTGNPFPDDPPVDC